jgi:hypothetical protein
MGDLGIDVEIILKIVWISHNVKMLTALNWLKICFISRLL